MVKEVKKVQDDITKTLDTITTKVRELADEAVSYAKKHKKLIIIGVALFVAYKFIFGEEESDDE